MNKSDLEIAQAAKIQHISDIAGKIGVKEEHLELFGKYKAKLPLSLIDPGKIKKSKLVLVTALTPTHAGEGKTTSSVGLADGLNRIGKKAMVVLREPSLGPVFGMKGGAAGGGYSQVIPMDDINLHFTGDFAAIEKANNLLSALIDNNLQCKTRNANLDARTVFWKRVVDVNDRSLRQTIVGLGGTANGIPREEGFNITAASEVMAIVCMAENIGDLKKKLGNIFVGFTFDKKPVYARDINAEGALAILLKDAIKPNLVQTLEGNPAIIHGGPFANIAHGTNTIIATKMGLSLSDIVITEAGFGADLGAEKFLNIKCGYAGLKPDGLVLVATIRALRHHGGAKEDDLNTPSVEKVEIGLANLKKHIENCKKFGLIPLVAINCFQNDTPEEIAAVKSRCAEWGVKAVESRGWEKGSEGTVDIANAVNEMLESGNNNFKPLYDWNASIKDKISTIATEIYGAKNVEYTKVAQTALRRISKLKLNHLPICMAKTQYSFSDAATSDCVPEGFTITVRDIEIAAGAGFVVPIAGKIMRMPGLPTVPASEHMDIDSDGRITGLS